MIWIVLILAIAALILTIASAVPSMNCPLWVPLLLLCIAVALPVITQVAPK